MNQREPDAAILAQFNTILKSAGENDYALFCSVMDDHMKHAITQKDFENATTRIASFCQADAAKEYMGTLKQGESLVHFWKLSAPGGNDDCLARMGVKCGLVSGILFSPPFDTAFQRTPPRS